MDHPFRTRRPELARTAEGISIATDALVVAAMTSEDLARLVARRESEVVDPAAHAVLARRAHDLGLLLETLDTRLPAPALSKPHGAAWAALLRGSGPLPDAACRALEDAASTLTARRSTLEALEGLPGDESSYSDYSDSKTESSGSDEEESEESEESHEEESEEETKQKPALPAPRKRR